MGGIYTMLLAEITKRLSADRKRKKKRKKKKTHGLGLGGGGVSRLRGIKRSTKGD